MGLFDSFTGDPGKDAAAKNAALYQQYGTQAGAALDSALPKSETALTGAINAYTPLSDLGKSLGQGTSAYMDALGLNGPDGTARSRAAYQSSPGFGFQVDTATDAAARNAAKLGLAGSGNTLQEISDRAGNIANTDYNQNYLQPLAGLVNPAISATGAAAAGQASGETNLSNLYQTDANNRANIYGNVTGGETSANTAAANAATAGNANFWNSLIKVAGIAAAPFTGGASLATLGMPSGTTKNAAGGAGFPGGSLTG